MANLKAIRKRITSVKSTQQITKAMKMVAAAKLRRAQDSMQRGRPYAHHLIQTVSRLAERVDPESSPLLRSPSSSRTLLVVVTSDRGLCGGFNSNVIRAAERYTKENAQTLDSIEMAFIGRRGYDYFRRRSQSISHYFRDIFGELTIERVKDDITSLLLQEFLDGKFDKLVLLYNEFVSVVSQNTTFKQLLPVAAPEGEDDEHAGTDYIYEPSQEALLEHLLPLYVTNTVFNALRESYAAEMGARMSAMENATNNASEMIDKLTLEFNRARQAAITTELIEIVSGAEAL